MKSIIRIGWIIVLFTACGPSRTVTFHAIRPAEITMPSDIKTILLVDRTKVKDKTMNIIEGILTGELPGDDKAAAQEAMMSMKNKLDESPRFDVRLFPGRLEGNSFTNSFPEALEWEKVQKLCDLNAAQVVVCLEIFDSDFIITNGTRIKKRYTGEGANRKEVEYTEYFAEGAGRVKIGYRLYDPKDKRIIDQQVLTENNRWEGSGVTKMDAVAALINKSNANKYLASQSGIAYAYKISPLPITITRPFYGKSKKVPEMQEGSRYADVNDWTGAIDAWKKGLAKASPKDAGKLAYDIAIAYEVKGEYGTAKNWAQDAYTKYGNKEGRDYVYQLDQRIREETLLGKQMAE